MCLRPQIEQPAQAAGARHSWRCLGLVVSDRGPLSEVLLCRAPCTPHQHTQIVCRHASCIIGAQLRAALQGSAGHGCVQQVTGARAISLNAAWTGRRWPRAAAGLPACLRSLLEGRRVAKIGLPCRVHAGRAESARAPTQQGQAKHTAFSTSSECTHLLCLALCKGCNMMGWLYRPDRLACNSAAAVTPPDGEEACMRGLSDSVQQHRVELSSPTAGLHHNAPDHSGRN